MQKYNAAKFQHFKVVKLRCYDYEKAFDQVNWDKVMKV